MRKAFSSISIVLLVGTLVACASAGLKVKSAEVATLEAITVAVQDAQRLEQSAFRAGFVPVTQHREAALNFIKVSDAITEAARESKAWTGATIPPASVKRLLDLLLTLRDTLPASAANRLSEVIR